MEGLVVIGLNSLVEEKLLATSDHHDKHHSLGYQSMQLDAELVGRNMRLELLESQKMYHLCK